MRPIRNDDHYRPEIDGLRCLAVVGVLLCHYKIHLFSGGFAGVDVFFVISGYLISGMILRDIQLGRFSFKSFYVRRARRLLPALYFTLLGSLLVAALVFAPERMQEFSRSLIATALSASNFLFWSEAGYFDAASNLKPLLHTWSLGVEEQFYLFWPLMLVLMARWKASLLSTLLLLLGASLAANYAWQAHSSAIFFLLPFRVFEFAIGGLVVQTEQSWRFSRPAKEALSLAGIAMVIASYLVFNEGSRFPSFPALLPCAGAAFIIAGGPSTVARWMLSNKATLSIGRWSYSIYLVHWPMIVFYEYTTLSPLGRSSKIILILATVAIGAGIYRFIEQPFRLRSGSVPRLLPTTFPKWATATAFMFIIIGATAVPGGWLWRLGDSPTLALEAVYGGNGCGDRCDTSPGKPVSIFLIGDSHAQQYMAGFKAAFPSLNTRIYQFSSCPFFSIEYTRDFTSYLEPALYDRGCRASRRSAFEDIKNSPAVVVISQYWVNFPLVSEKSGQRLAPTDMNEATTIVSDQIAILKRELGINRVFIVGSVPTMTNGIASPSDCISRPIPAPVGCASSPRNFGPPAERAAINDLLRSKVFPFLDPFDALCSATSCGMIIDGKPVYSDQTHLTTWGSELVVASFRRSLTEVVSFSQSPK